MRKYCSCCVHCGLFGICRLGHPTEFIDGCEKCGWAVREDVDDCEDYVEIGKDPYG